MHCYATLNQVSLIITFIHFINSQNCRRQASALNVTCNENWRVRLRTFNELIVGKYRQVQKQTTPTVNFTDILFLQKVAILGL